MKFYLEITLLPNPEVGIHFLWSKVYQQIHLGLVAMQAGQGRVPIGVAFPEYVQGYRSRLPADDDTGTSQHIEKFGVLGGKLRLFAADEATLSQFNASHWLARLSDYVHCTRIRPVPDKLVGYAHYQRLQPKINPERLARRYTKRWGKHYPGEAAPDFAAVFTREIELSVRPGDGNADTKQRLRYCDMPRPDVCLPFIRLPSLSNKQMFRLWIKKTVVAGPMGATFSSYGLSATSTVPEF